MRLLKKNEVDDATRKEKATEIKQGLLITRRIDSLRETLAEEEVRLTMFRTRTISAINDEIKEQNMVMMSLKLEVAELERTLKTGHKELDVRATKLEERESDVVRSTEILDRELKECRLRSSMLSSREEYTKEARTKAVILHADAAKARDDARTELHAAHESIKHLDKTKALVLENLKKLTTKQETDALELFAYEGRLKDYELGLSAQAIEIEKRSRAVDDKYQALLNAQKHLSGT